MKGLELFDSVCEDLRPQIRELRDDRANAQAEVATGLRSKLAYLMDYRGMTETEALAEIERIKAETPVVSGFFGA